MLKHEGCLLEVFIIRLFNQTLSIYACFCLISSSFLHQKFAEKCKKHGQLAWPAFGMPSTLMLVKIYNTDQTTGTQATCVLK